MYPKYFCILHINFSDSEFTELKSDFFNLSSCFKKTLLMLVEKKLSNGVSLTTIFLNSCNPLLIYRNIFAITSFLLLKSIQRYLI